MNNIFSALLNMQFINRPLLSCLWLQNESPCGNYAYRNVLDDVNL